MNTMDTGRRVYDPDNPSNEYVLLHVFRDETTREWLIKLLDPVPGSNKRHMIWVDHAANYKLCD